jgi:Na+/melibiose symporter-like transporter
MLADLLEKEGLGAGSCFGWWNFTGKLNLALAAGCALPLLGWLGYVPGSGAGRQYLAWVYAGLPAVLKLAALLLLWRLACKEHFS